MPVKTKAPYTTGSPSFDPDQLFAQWPSTRSSHLPQANDLRSAILKTFSLPPTDTFTYHAIASVTLSQVQEAIAAGRAHHLHAWYRAEDDRPLEPPPQADIEAYTTLFSPSTTPDKAYKSFASNARKGSIRGSSAAYLLSQRSPAPSIQIPRNKAFVNPAFDFWVWACKELEWCGPVPETEKVRLSHHVLPIMMHHFSCLCPSYEGLEVIRQAAAGREIYDIGSGNGYWTYMLRRMGCKVLAVDNAQSEWRTMWIGDTVVADGAKFLRSTREAGKAGVCLMVYPIVGEDFTSKTIEAYEGDIVIIAGTMNGNGYTTFKDERIEQWMGERGWRMQSRVPLPSFPGKDEGLYVFERDKP